MRTWKLDDPSTDPAPASGRAELLAAAKSAGVRTDAADTDRAIALSIIKAAGPTYAAVLTNASARSDAWLAGAAIQCASNMKRGKRGGRADAEVDERGRFRYDSPETAARDEFMKQNLNGFETGPATGPAPRRADADASPSSEEEARDAYMKANLNGFETGGAK